MSSFKRKGAQTSRLPGTKVSPTSPTVLTSTGSASLDDILGGGLPLSCSLVILAPDIHSSYGELVQKYFIAQGLATGQDVCIVHHEPEEFARHCMWLGEAEQQNQPAEEKVKIAWRYGQMKQFETTPASDDVEYCRIFDLGSQMPASIVETCVKSERLCGISDLSTVHAKLVEVLQRKRGLPLRISIPSLGSPHWGEMSPQEILLFLHNLRSLLRLHPHACASVSLVPHIATDAWGGTGWIQKLGWIADSAISLDAFGGDPSLISEFPAYHGFVHVYSLPVPLTLTAASDRHSRLRSLGLGGENNLGMKMTRKRLIIETLHLDIEGGISERRTVDNNNKKSVGFDLEF